jgi:hypothetical protein
MTTKLDKPLKREVQIGEKAYTLTIDPAGLKLVEKGHRKGPEVSWTELASRDADGGSPTPTAMPGRAF